MASTSLSFAELIPSEYVPFDMKVLNILGVFTIILVSLTACAQKNKAVPMEREKLKMENLSNGTQSKEMDTAVFGAGCFWCVEAVFQRLEGVKKVQSGYAGGHIKNPSYKEVCTGRTGHAEVARITYDPNVISYAELLEVFWLSHDPTQLNRQGNDVGTQYRSAIFYLNEHQKELAQKAKDLADNSELWENPIVTEISELDHFYPAEDYHQNYYNDNSRQPYCAVVITPKVEKVKKLFRDILKDSYKD